MRKARLLARTVADANCPEVARRRMRKAWRQNNIRANADAHGEPLQLKPLPLTLARMSQGRLCAYVNNKRTRKIDPLVRTQKRRGTRLEPRHVLGWFRPNVRFRGQKRISRDNEPCIKRSRVERARSGCERILNGRFIHYIP